MTIECNADLDHPCDADDGEPCQACCEEHDYWRRYFAGMPREYMRTQSEIDAELVDAGRGHLVRGR
jgi:hypothetical protein